MTDMRRQPRVFSFRANRAAECGSVTSSMTPDASFDLVQSVQGLQAGTLKPADLVRHCLATIATREPAVGAWANVAAEDALACAGSAGGSRAVKRYPHRRQRHHRCARHGHGMQFANLRDALGHRGRDGVARARAAGTIVLGKTTTQEFATRGSMPATRNPHSAAHTPGILQRICGRGRCGHGTACAQHANCGLDCPPGVLLRNCRLQALVWLDATGWRQDHCAFAGHPGSAHAHGGGRLVGFAALNRTVQRMRRLGDDQVGSRLKRSDSAARSDSTWRPDSSW